MLIDIVLLMGNYASTAAHARHRRHAIAQGLEAIATGALTSSACFVSGGNLAARSALIRLVAPHQLNRRSGLRSPKTHVERAEMPGLLGSVRHDSAIKIFANCCSQNLRLIRNQLPTRSAQGRTQPGERRPMRKAIIALAAMATIVIASIGNADAQYYRRGPSGGAVAAGVIGGLAAGAIIGGAIASSRPAYAYPAYALGAAAMWPMRLLGTLVRVACPGGYVGARPRFDLLTASWSATASRATSARNRTGRFCDGARRRHAPPGFRFAITI